MKTKSLEPNFGRAVLYRYIALPKLRFIELSFLRGWRQDLLHQPVEET